jgi:hypothetical protein
MSTTAPFTFDEPGLADWLQLHQAAMARMSELANALDRQGWMDVDRVCRWLRDQFHPHNDREEAVLLPLLEAAGAVDLGRQLSADHKEMSDLSRALLDGHRGGTVRDPGGHGLRARRLLDLVRQHIDTEEHFVLPLLQGRRPLPEPGATGPGYQAPVVSDRPKPRRARRPTRFVAGR